MGKNNIDTKKKLHAADMEDAAFSNDKERIRYMSRTYNKMSIGESFKEFYDLEEHINVENTNVNEVPDINVGDCYVAFVKEFDKHGIIFEIPGVKDTIICKENFGSCIDMVRNYLLTHENKLLFEVVGHKKDVYTVSVINGMYKMWRKMIENAIYKKTPINVHIDGLTKGGYLCHTLITTLYELTGKEYTHSVFIPGSAIVLNIENDFEQWIGKDVQIIPQKFGEFFNVRLGVVENSLVGSRKQLLQQQGYINLYEIYNKYLLTKSEQFKTNPEHLQGHVTGIINSGKKTGVFVELDDKYITGLMPIDKMDLINFKPGDSVIVYPAEFEIKEGTEPFVINKKGDIVRCNTRVVFGLVD